MDLKLLKLKSTILWLRLSGKIRRQDHPVELPLRPLGTRAVLIIFPLTANEFHTAIKMLYTFLERLDHQRRVVLLIAQDNYRPDLPFSHQIIQFDPEHLIELKLQGIFDLVIDLNRGFNWPVARFVSGITAPYKAGFSSELADVFYNLQYVSPSGATPERDYEFFQTLMDPS